MPNPSPRNTCSKMVHHSESPQTCTSTTETHTTTSNTPPPRDVLFSASDTILKDLRTESALGIYGATHNLHNRAEYFLGGWDSDLLVLRNNTELMELVIRGVFNISRSKFYFTPDANYDPANSFNSKLEDVKLTCRLTASHHADFKFSSDDFPTIADNLHKIEKLIKKQPESQSFSIIDSICGTETIRLSHSLFKVSPIMVTSARCSITIILPQKKKFDENGDEIIEETDDSASDSEDARSASKILIFFPFPIPSSMISIPDSTERLASQFQLNNWPVGDRCKSALADLAAANTHDIQPLRAYDTDGSILSPTNYENKLHGATVLVAMAFFHRYIKKNKRHVFTLQVCEITILRPPPAKGPSSPYKRRKLTKSVLTSHKGKGVDRSDTA